MTKSGKVLIGILMCLFAIKIIGAELQITKVQSNELTTSQEEQPDGSVNDIINAPELCKDGRRRDRYGICRTVWVETLHQKF